MVGDLFRDDIADDADVIQMFYISNVGLRYDKLMLPLAYGFNVWSRLYKANIVKDFYNKIDRPIKVFIREDKLLFDAVCKVAHSWKYIPRVIYEYNYKNAAHNRSNKKKYPESENIAETFEAYKYIYTLLGMPQKTSGIIERVQEILNREYTRA